MPFMKDYPVMSREIRVFSKLDSLKDYNTGYNDVFIHLKKYLLFTSKGVLFKSHQKKKQ